MQGKVDLQALGQKMKTRSKAGKAFAHENVFYSNEGMTYTWRHVYWVYCHLSETNNFSPHSSRTWPTQAAETASAQSLHPCLFLLTHACWRGPAAPPSLPLCVPRLWSSMCSHPGTRRSIWWSRGVVEGKGLHLPRWGSGQPSPINLLDRHRH